MTEMDRDINDVLSNISNVINTRCQDAILQSHWNKQLIWFSVFDNQRKQFWNIAPEVIKQIKWMKLAEIVNSNIPKDKFRHDWEEIVVNIFTGGLDIPEMMLHDDEVICLEEEIYKDITYNNEEYSNKEYNNEEYNNETYNNEEYDNDYYNDYYYNSDDAEEREKGRMEHAASRHEERRER